MKRIFISLTVLIALLVCGCTPKTEYDGKEISKIEVVSVSFMVEMFPHEEVRTFDFQANAVFDETVVDPAVLEEAKLHYENLDTDRYNSPIEIADFTDEQEAALLSEIKKLGFLAWGDRYVTSDSVCDGGSHTITVYFADGTLKSTYVFFEYPKNYEKINAAFKNRLGALLSL